MPPDGPSPEDPREWLRRARSNLARASQGQFSPHVLLEDVCFEAPQAVQKALEALLALALGGRAGATAEARQRYRSRGGR